MGHSRGGAARAIASLFMTLAVFSLPALSQGTPPQLTGLVLTNSNTASNNPFLWLQDSTGDSGVVPILEITGGQTASTLGVEVTSQANSTTGNAPPLSTIMPAGYGGLSLVQNSTATSSTGVSSPVFAMCGSQYGDKVMPANPGPACWSWQILGGSGNDPADTLQLQVSNSQNNTNIFTVLFPASVNLATAPYTGTSPSAGQITVGPAPYSGTNANVPATFTGASTSSTSSAQAGPAIIQPGELTANNPASTSTEGQLELMQSYRGTNNSGTNYYLLACSDTSTPQGVVVCGTSTSAAQVVGVYNSNPQQAGATITPIRYGRALIANFGAAATWTSGDYVCRDTTNNGYVVDNGTTPCLTGQAVGTAAGDTNGSTNDHGVDLAIPPNTQAGAVMTFFCDGAVGTGSDYMFPSASGTTCSETGMTNNYYVQPVSFSGTLRNLEVFYGKGPGSGVSDVFTVWLCSGTGTSRSATTLSCSASGGSSTTPAACHDTTDSATVSLGQGIQIVDAPGSGSMAQNARITVQIQ